MTRETLYKNIKVIKGKRWCRICDSEADFVIINTTALGDLKGLSLCKKCAEILKEKIDIGLSL